MILIGRHPQNHEVRHHLICDGKIILSDCSYHDGYQRAASLMKLGDTLQEIQGKESSRKLTYSVAVEGHLMLNWDTIHKKNEE